MAIIPDLKRFAIACAALGVMPLWSAGEPYAFDLKVHAGIAGGSMQKDRGDNKVFGFGLEGRYALGGERALVAELSYDILGARWRDVTPTSGKVYAQPSGGGAPVTTMDGTTPLVLSPTTSIDLRKQAAQGFSLRMGYTDALPWGSGLTWRAGLSLDAYRVNAEFTGTLVPQDADGNPYDDGSGKDYYEGWAFVKSKTKIGVGAFAGVGLKLNDNLRMEFNLRSMSTGHYDYQPFTYTGRAAVLEEKSRQSIGFEIGLALKL